MSQIPSGQVATAAFAPLQHPVYGNRNQSFFYELLDNEDVFQNSLEGVTGGSLTWNANANVQRGGKITVVQRSRDQHNWLKRRIKVWMKIDGLDTYALGVYVCSAPSESWTDSELTLDIDLLDKTSILDNDYVAATYSVPEGAQITDRVRDLIVSTGEKAGSITDADAKLNKAMVWEAGTSKLSIVNDLLAAANYNGLMTDGEGRFRVEKNVLPKDRPNAHFFSDGFESIYLPNLAYAKDLYSVPNKVVIIGQGDGDKEPEVAIATNENADSPYSYQSRGFWIVDVTKGVEATDAETLQEKARKRLTDLTSPTGTITIDHAPLPWLGLNDVVRFKRTTADIDIRASIQSTQISLDPTALQHTELQEVAEL